MSDVYVNLPEVERMLSTTTQSSYALYNSFLELQRKQEQHPVYLSDIVYVSRFLNIIVHFKRKVPSKGDTLDFHILLVEYAH